MILVVMKSDIEALRIVKLLDPKALNINLVNMPKSVLCFESAYGGNKWVAVYTLPPGLMPLKGKKTDKRLSVSLYQEKSGLGVLDVLRVWFDSSMSVKRQNRIERTKNRPKELGKCDVYAMFNRGRLSAIDYKNTIGYLVQMTKTEIPKHLSGHGGSIVFGTLAETGRVVTNKSDLPRALRSNSVYAQVTGFTKPIVSYGTTDLANVFELLQALKLGNTFELPVVFDSHRTAHNWGYWRNGFLNPSLALLGRYAKEGQFGLFDSDKYTTQLGVANLSELLKTLGLASIDGVAPNADLATLYMRATKTLADVILSLLDIKVRYALVDFAEVCAKTEFWHMTANQFARIVETSSRHPVVLLNTPDGNQLKTNSNALPNETIETLYKRGWWLGGYPIYFVGFSLGKYGGMVTMVKDSKAGNVNLASREYLTGSSGLHLTPVGLFRLTAQGQNEDWSIDPLVMLEIINRWGVQKSKIELNKVWNAMEVPLKVENIGKKTIATVSLKGISIKVVKS